MKTHLPAIALSLVLLIATGLKDSFGPTLYYPYVVVDASAGIQLKILQRGQSSSRCSQSIATQIAAIQGSCAVCRIVESSCLGGLGDAQMQWLGESHLDTASVRMANGVITYESVNPSLALLTCQESERQSRANPAASRVTCYPAGTVRPLPAAERDRLARNRSAYVGFLEAGSVFAVALATLLLLGSFRRRALNGSAAPQSADPSPARAPGGAKFRWIQKLALAGADTLVLLGVFALLGFPLADDVPAWVRYDIKTLAVHCALVAITVGWFWTGLEHYARRRPFWDELRDILRTLSFMFLLAGATVFYAGLDAGRGTYLWVWAFTFVLLPLARAVAKAILEALDLWQRPAVILGTGQNARDACLALKSEHGMGYRIDAFIELENDNAANSERIEMEGEAYPILAPRNGLEALLAELGKPQLILALETLSTPKMQTLVQQLAATEHNIHVIPAIRGLPLFGTQLSHFFSHQVLFLTIRNNLSRRSYRWTKRLFDLVAASALLVLLSPVLLALAILIRRTGGTALYSHTRIGRDGRPFQCLKFRSMRPDADRVLEELLAKDAQARSEWEKDLKLKNDPRVTALGRFLRKTSLDELPQLINVIKGEMSLVGPRPIVSEELQRYGECAMLYLQVLPGITGLWQISGRNDTSYAERVSLDAWYVQNWSLWYDIAILFKTVNVVLNRRGAY